MSRRRTSRLVGLGAAGLVLGGLGVAAAPIVFTGRAPLPPAAIILATAPLSTASVIPVPRISGTGGAIPDARPANVPDVVPLTASKTSVAAVKKKAPEKPHFTILHIGDSHTAADFFTGRVRSRLQKSFGAGGLYLPPGLPHVGIRSDALAIKVSAGWAYQSMAKSTEKERFWLTGYTAASSAPNSEITFTAPRPVSFDAIDVSFLRQRGAGSVDILLDGTMVDRIALDGPDGEPLIHRLLPFARLDSFRQLSIRADSAAPVSFTGVFVEQRVSGVSYLSVGFPGATVQILEQMSSKNLADDVARIAPDMIVLAFGTNEGFDDKLDIQQYRHSFASIIRAITTARPGAAVVVIGPPAGARKAVCASDLPASDTSAPTIDASVSPPKDCWITPRNLDAVRDIQKDVAAEEGATFWDWSKTLPSADDLLKGRRGTPPLFGPDRVHLTQDGYRKTADAFATFLTPLVKKGMAAR